MNKSLGLGLIGLLIVVLLIALISTQTDNQDIDTITPTPTIESPTPTEGEEASPTPDQTTSPSPTGQQISPTPTLIMQGWNIFQSNNPNFTMQYPGDVTVERQTGGRVLFMKFGPTQRTGTEFYDGISVAIDMGNLGNQTLRQYTEGQLEEEREGPTYQSSSGISEVQVAGEDGFRYEITSLGTHEYTYLPYGDDGYLVIINSTVDPTNQGYEQTAQRMISTLEIDENQ